MRYLFICLWIVLFPAISRSQTDTLIYKIVYDFTLNALNFSVPGTQNIVLYSEKSAVSWNDLSGIPNNEDMNKRVDRGAKVQYVFKNFVENKVVFEAKTGLLPRDRTVFMDTLYPMQWKISGEDSTINSFKCIKATCTFRGRDYEAWFNPEIPIREGPWKFGGLPGLIVSIQDIEGKYTWKFASLTKTTEVIPSTPESKGNYDDFVTLFKAGVKKMQEATRAGGSSVDPNCIGCGQNATITVELIERF